MKILQGMTALALASLTLWPAAPAQAQAGRPLSVNLSGGADPVQGDIDGSGTAWLLLNQGQERLCYELTVRGTAPVSNVRLVEASSGRSLLLLQNGVGMAARCVEADKDLVKAVRKEPGRYQIVVGTSQYPQGALRGSLANPTADQILERISRGGGLPDDLAQVDWAQVNWESIDWESVDWDALDLAAIDWEQMDFTRVDWQAIDARAVVIRSLEEQGIDWRALDLDAIDWERIDWANVDWDAIDWRAIDWQTLDLRSVDWERLTRGSPGRGRGPDRGNAGRGNPTSVDDTAGDRDGDDDDDDDDGDDD